MTCIKLVMALLLFVIASWCNAQSEIDVWTSHISSPALDVQMREGYRFPAITNQKEIDQLIGNFKSTNTSIQKYSIAAAGELLVAPKKVIPALLSCLEDSSDEVRTNAIIALVKYDSLSIPFLMPLISNQRSIGNKRIGKDGQTFLTVSDVAITTLINMRCSLIKPLFVAYVNSSYNIQNYIEYILTNNDYVIFEDLTPYFDDANWDLRSLSHRVAVGRATYSHLEYLLKRLDNEDGTSQLIVKIILAVGPECRPYLPRMLEKISGDEGALKASIQAIFYFGFREAIPAVIAASSQDTRFYIYQLIASNGDQSLGDVLIPYILKDFISDNEELSEIAGSALSVMIGSDTIRNIRITEKEVYSIIGKLNSANEDIQIAAAEILGTCRQLPIATSNMVCAGLKKNIERRSNSSGFSISNPKHYAVLALGELANENPMALTILLELLSKETKSTRELHPSVITAFNSLNKPSQLCTDAVLKRVANFASDQNGLDDFLEVLIKISPNPSKTILTILQSQDLKSMRMPICEFILDKSLPLDHSVLTSLSQIVDSDKSPDDLKLTAAQILIKNGNEERGAVNVIIANLKTGDDVWEVVGPLDDSTPGLKLLNKLLPDTALHLSRYVLKTLFSKTPSRSIDSVIVASLIDSNEDMRDDIADFLGQVNAQRLMDLSKSQPLIYNVSQLIRNELKTRSNFETSRVERDSFSVSISSVTQPVFPAIELLGKVSRFDRKGFLEFKELLSFNNSAIRVATVRQIESLRHDTLGIGQVLSRMIFDEDFKVRLAAAESLIAISQLDSLPLPVLTVILDHHYQIKFEIEYDKIADRFRPSPLVSGRYYRLPPLHWPPPKYSHIATFGVDLPRTLLGLPTSTLGEVRSKIARALHEADPYFESGLFEAPGGFALLAKMERTDENGIPLPGRYRWIRGKVPPLNFSDYIGRLFFETPGYFRVIAFVLTDQSNFGYSDDKDADDLPDIEKGGTILPHDISEKKLADVNAYILVYSLKRLPGGQVTRYNSLSALAHLQNSGIYNNLSLQR